MKISLVLILTLFFAYTIHAQISIGQWREHYSFNKLSKIEKVKNKIYCASLNGIFTYDLETHAIEKITKLNILSGYDITTLKYFSARDLVFIGYADGNIDLLQGNTIRNISDIKRKNLYGSKKINTAIFVDNLAYLACDFGIVVVNLDKYEIADTYYIGSEGSRIKINDLANDGTNFYAATSAGVYKANASSQYLYDYKNWNKIANLPDPDADYSSVAILNGKVYANVLSLQSGTNYVYEIGATVKVVHSAYNYIFYIRSDAKYLFAMRSYYMVVIDKDGNQVMALDEIANDAVSDDVGNIYLASETQGLLIYSPTKTKQIVGPNSPAYPNVIDISIANDQLWAAAGSPSTQYERKGAYSFINETWKSYNINTLPELESVYNISSVAVHPFKTGVTYGGSWGYGLVEFIDGKVNKIYTEKDGLKNIAPYTSGFIRVEGMSFDKSQNLWISCSLVNDPIYRLTPEGKIVNLKFKYTGMNLQKLGNIMVTSTNQKWVILKDNGIFIFDDKGNERKIDILDKSGSSISNNVLCMAEDKDGQIWVGTDKGIVVYRSTESAFTSSLYYGTQIIKGGQYLFSTETIRNIAIDGANRKWVGTESGGVYLMSSDASEEIFHFTRDNSPLYSNQITALAINQKSGEVFFGNLNGITSYRAAATEASTYFSDVYVYPNPVRETFTGDIIVTGLVEQTLVKITDVAGNIVFETTSLGGQAVWNGKNFDGKRVSTGVYLVYCSSQDGLKTEVTKLLFIN